MPSWVCVNNLITESGGNDAHCEYKQHNYERTLRNCAGFLMVVLGEEEQGTQAELLNVEPYKYMLNCFGEKESPGVAGAWLVVDPSEQVLVQEIEEKEGRKCDAVDDGRYDGITERDDGQLCH
jgi:hypothetical protein